MDHNPKDMPEYISACVLFISAHAPESVSVADGFDCTIVIVKLSVKRR